MSTLIASILIGAIATMNVAASALLFRSAFETRFQKVAQLILIWILPLVGAVFVMAVAWNQKGQSRADPSSDASESGVMPGIDLHAGDINSGDPWGGGHGHGGDGH